MQKTRSTNRVSTGSLKRTDLIEEVSRVVEGSLKDGEVILDQILASIVHALQAGDKAEIRGFGAFHTRQRKARIARNPKTGASVAVPPKRVPFFKPSKELKQLMNPGPESPEPTEAEHTRDPPAPTIVRR
jgi:integration host factor subunit beta